jgi:hypothetical protein
LHQFVGGKDVHHAMTVRRGADHIGKLESRLAEKAVSAIAFELE